MIYRSSFVLLDLKQYLKMKTEKLQQIVDRLNLNKNKEEDRLQDTLTRLRKKYDAEVKKAKEEAEKRIALITPDIVFYERLLKEQQKIEAMQKEVDNRYKDYIALKVDTDDKSEIAADENDVSDSYGETMTQNEQTFKQ